MLLLLAVLAIGSGVACEQAPDPILKIGLIGVFEGPMAGASGIPGREGARMAVEEINAAGGVMVGRTRYRLELREREVENRPDAAAGMARALINLDSVHLLIGPQTSALATAAAAVAEASEVLMIAPMASSPAVTAGRTFVFRLSFVDAFQGEVLARFAYDSLRIRRAAILHDAASTYGNEISRLFRETFEAAGGRVVGTETFNADASNQFEPQLRRLLAANPDAILLPNFVTHDSAQIRQARALGFRGRFLGSDSWDVRALSPRDDAIGSIIVANWDRRSVREPVQRFLAAWQARHSHPARATAAATYDAVYLAVDAAHRAGSLEGTALADALRARGTYGGAVAEFEFHGTNDPSRGAVILEVVRDSTWRVRTTVPPPRR
jgi:branched-chain amino acid transport system substrate-binding protein